MGLKYVYLPTTFILFIFVEKQKQKTIPRRKSVGPEIYLPTIFTFLIFGPKQIWH